MKNGHDGVLAMVCLKNSTLPATDLIISHLRHTHPDLPEIKDITRSNDILQFVLGKFSCSVALMPGSIPWNDLDGPCQTAWYWPEADETLKKHVTHVVIFIGKGESDVLEANLALTYIVDAVAQSTDSLGIYWGGGSLVHPIEMFHDFAKDADRNTLPLFIWIGFRIEKNDDSTLCLYTEGMQTLGKNEIEVAKSSLRAQELLDFAMAVADYVLTTSAPIHSGETIGRTDDEKYRIVFAKSLFPDRAEDVMQLELAEEKQ